MDGSRTVEELEMDLLLEAVFQHLGYDFRGFNRAQLRQKLFTLMQDQGAATISALQDRVLHDAYAGQALLRTFGSQEATLFADPDHLRVLRSHMDAHFRSHPNPRIWLAECGSPHAAWTIAIVLEELNLYDKTLVFATDANAELAHHGWQTPIPARSVADCEDNYRRSGGANRLAAYFEGDAEQVNLQPRLRKNIVWAQHNLVTDASFNEFQLIICRGALADYGPLLCSRTLRLLHDSLSPLGILSIDATSAVVDQYLANAYKPIDSQIGVYKRMV